MIKDSFLSERQNNLLGKKMMLKKCPEPANIIWDNIRVKSCRYHFKVLLYLVLIGIMLLGAFASVVYLQKYSI